MSKEFDVKDLLNFEVLLFPKVAKICYFLLVGISVLFGFVSFIRGLGMDWGGGAVVFSGLLMMTIVPVFIRLWFEFLLLLFMIHDKLSDIRSELTKPADDTEG